MRRSVLLLVTILTGVVVASGIALADSFTCSTSTKSSPCQGTSGDDQITGTIDADFINGLGGADTISSLGGNDKVNGGEGNDTMDAGEGNDSYRFSDNRGTDSISDDTSGVDTIDFSPITTAPGTGLFPGVFYDISGPRTCNSTSVACPSLGGNFIENLVGTDFGDILTGNSLKNKISGRSGNDRLIGGDGPDKLFGGDGIDQLFGLSGNDKLNGGADASPDHYGFSTNWGKDVVTADGGGFDKVEPMDGATAAVMPDMKVDLVGGTGPEVTDGNGNTINWSAEVIIENAATGAGNDEISQSPAINVMFGGAGSDTYKGFAPSSDNSDTVSDASGSADELDLTSFNVPSASSWSTQSDTPSGNVRSLLIELRGATDNNQIKVVNYFNATSTDVCSSSAGPGLIETISFADDPNVDFAQVRSLLGCP